MYKSRLGGRAGSSSGSGLGGAGACAAPAAAVPPGSWSSVRAAATTGTGAAGRRPRATAGIVVDTADGVVRHHQRRGGGADAVPDGCWAAAGDWVGGQGWRDCSWWGQRWAGASVNASSLGHCRRSGRHSHHLHHEEVGGQGWWPLETSQRSGVN